MPDFGNHSPTPTNVTVNNYQVQQKKHRLNFDAQSYLEHLIQAGIEVSLSACFITFIGVKKNSMIICTKISKLRLIISVSYLMNIRL